MKSLDHRIPPPLVALVIAVAMWATARFTPHWGITTEARTLLVVIFAVAGVVVTVSGARTFSRAGTTKNPMNPGAATVLVRSGIFRFTRNPMYLGLVLILVAWALFFAAPWALWGPLAFLLYMDRFQVRPEEAAMARLFGADYAEYCNQVRRWL